MISLGIRAEDIGRRGHGRRRASARAFLPTWWTLEGLPQTSPRKRQHGVAHRRIQRRRGVVIKVNRPRHRRIFRKSRPADEKKADSGTTAGFSQTQNTDKKEQATDSAYQFRKPRFHKMKQKKKPASFTSTGERGGFDMPAGKLILHRP
jgi:hypothetical protein